MAHLETFKSYIKAQNKAPLSFGEGLGVRPPKLSCRQRRHLFLTAFQKNQDTSVVGMTAPKDAETSAETDSASPYILLVLRILNPTVMLEKAEL
jgi:hypothetical protein